ncbi:MAG: DUF2807 domain-containing protein [Bacteroidales bacterium]|nr:DUF2807 domain-containing protein [Bacteroidales bacterium]
MKRSTLLCAILLATSMLSAQTTIVGSGPMVKQERKLEAFNTVNNPSTFDITITRSSDYRAVVTADGNLIDYILTEVENGTLTVSIKSGISYSNAHVTITIFTPHLNEVVMKGTGNVTALSVKEDSFTATCKGTGSFKCDCLLVTKDLILQNSGTGNMDVSYMCQNTVIIKNSGTGNISLSMLQNVTSSMKIQNSGTGSIVLKKLSVGDLQLKNLGTGDITLSGKADNMTLVNNGTGNVQANKLSVKTAHIIQNSVGGINAYVTEKAYLTRKNKTGNLKITGGGEVVMEMSIEEIREFLNE